MASSSPDVFKGPDVHQSWSTPLLQSPGATDLTLIGVEVGLGRNHIRFNAQRQESGFVAQNAFEVSHKSNREQCRGYFATPEAVFTQRPGWPFSND